MAEITSRFTPFLWFDGQAEEAANFYVSIFRNSRVRGIARYGAAGATVSGRPEGSVMTVDFELDGQAFAALNGGPIFTFSPAISFVVNCEAQQEVDEYWQKLTAGGSIERCGWLKDKYGVSWQVVPTAVSRMFLDQNPEGTERVMSAMLPMKKLDLAALERAYAGI